MQYREFPLASHLLLAISIKVSSLIMEFLVPLRWEKLGTGKGSSAKPAKELRGKQFVKALMIFITKLSTSVASKRRSRDFIAGVS